MYDDGSRLQLRPIANKIISSATFDATVDCNNSRGDGINLTDSVTCVCGDHPRWCRRHPYDPLTIRQAKIGAKL